MLHIAETQGGGGEVEIWMACLFVLLWENCRKKSDMKLNLEALHGMENNLPNPVERADADSLMEYLR